METYIALLRGINISGHNLISMPRLIAIFTEMEFKNVRTYIQSGNVIFEFGKTDQDKLAKKIEAAILKSVGFQVSVIIRNRLEIFHVLENNPFLTGRNEDINKLFVTFMDSEPNPDDIKKVQEGDFDSDEFMVSGKEIYGFCPNGYGRTKLNTNFFEKKFRTTATARNWKTVQKLGIL
jgi:uncharacterized protein (DUF1697 family)